MIDDSVDVFPINVVQVIAARIQLMDADLRVWMRPLREGDGTQSVGVFPLNWQPVELSKEIGSREFATIQRYPIAIQSYILDTDEERGIRTHGVLAKRIRSLLSRDNPLSLALNALSVTMDGATERIQRRGATIQRYISNEIGGTFMYLATLEYFVETETT